MLEQWHVQGMAEDELRAKERLAAMAERSKSSLDETKQKVEALAAQGRASIEDARSRGLSRMAEIAAQQTHQARSNDMIECSS